MARAKINNVFVDREAAMKYLEKELEARIGDTVERTIRITQAPGTEKPGSCRNSSSGWSERIGISGHIQQVGI